MDSGFHYEHESHNARRPEEGAFMNTRHDGPSITSEIPPGCEAVLNPDAIAFLVELHRRFDDTRRQLLDRRLHRQATIDAGDLPHFLPETESIREREWTVAPIPHDLLDRRVEITGPVERKMIINALNSGANVFMADFEDSNSPTWLNNLSGHLNLCEAVRGEIQYVSPEGKPYEVRPEHAVLFVRPRGWHLDENHFLVDGRPISGSLFDFGLYFIHNAKALVANGTGPYFYLPKIQHYLEARLWNDVFEFAQSYVGLPHGVIRATVLIETILAAFQMDEILWELKAHSGGLNCGRWDYIFSFIKVFNNHASFVLPDRGQITMDRHFLKSYVSLLIRTCHRRGIHAMGGMAAQIPIKGDPVANEAAFEKVRQDKLREVLAGHDGTWVAHPGLVQIAKEVFDEHMPTSNQIHNKRADVQVTATDLLAVADGPITEQGLRLNIDVAIQYLASWLRGSGCVPIYHLMEDAATAEISRTQVWHWGKHNATLSDGRKITADLIRQMLESETQQARSRIGQARVNEGTLTQASAILESIIISHDLKEFLTVEAYKYL
jgi:malate synthase